MKRSAMTAVFAAVFLLGFRGTLAADGADVQIFPVSFVLSSTTCSNLPPGTTVWGTGTGKSITTSRTSRSGVTTIINSTHEDGTAVDQNGNSYEFQYSNDFQVSDATSPGTFSGKMTDHFSLSGGPARLTNGFTAKVLTDFVSFFLFPEVIQAHGDPVDFSTALAHCDPL